MAGASSNDAAAQSWLQSLRRAGADRFAAVGFPTTKDEEWRLTNVSQIAKTQFAAANAQIDEEAIELVKKSTFGSDAALELVFVNGHYAPSLSREGKLPRGAVACIFSQADDCEALERHLGQVADIAANPFIALNTGSMREGVVVHIAKGISVDQPIHLVFVSTTGAQPTQSFPRVLAVAEESSQLTLVESFVGGSGVHFTAAVTELVAANDSRIDHNHLHVGGDDAYMVSALSARLGRSSKLISQAATLGGKLTRNDLTVVLAGEGADATLNGLVMVSKDQHCDNHTLLDHAAAHCPSHELYKHVLNDRASCVFKGKILVRPDSQKTDSKQSSKSLLLSDDAQMNSQPALEIYADDVKCTHGSTTGPVDEEMVFYLRSRGVGLDAARHLLTYAFAADITRRIKIEPVRRRLEDFLAAQHGLPRDLRITDLGEHDEKAR
ncbi:MAG TPA: Fe-S cluster assembly protein SufD [Tepidisphaeraceae bacterium]